jgi:hypothetical protein
MDVREKTNAAPREQDLDNVPVYVFYEYCIALVFLTLRHPSRLYAYHPGWPGWRRGLPYTLLTLLLGWWSVPWGLIYTPVVVWTNLRGGRRVTLREQRLWSRDGAGS